MASLLVAITDKFDTLTQSLFPGSVRPGIYFDKAPPVNASGAQVQPTTAGYVVFRDATEDFRPMAFGDVSNETVEIEWKIFYPSLGDCLTVANVIRFNGGVPSARAGFDHGTLPTFTPPPTLRDIVCVKGARQYAGIGKTSVRVHEVRMTHRFCFTRSGS